MPSKTEKSVLTVSQLNRQARVTIEQKFQQVWVVGEISNFARPQSGHWYFSLKDQNAQVRCAMFASRNRSVNMQPSNGQLVIARGRVSLYEGRGDFQIIVDQLEAAGEGALRQAFDLLKVKLATEGLFDEQHKRPLPPLPEHIAVITSGTGAALSDVLAVWKRRFPSLRVTLIASAVQGAAAESELIDAIDKADQLSADIILLTRGGGSLEDLWSFNLESVTRALGKCQTPTVSAIGHEIDVTICDFIADLRAPTPSAAAELMVPNRTDLQQVFAHHYRQLNLLWRQQHERQSLKVTNLGLQIPRPEHVLERANQQVDDAGERLHRAALGQIRSKGITVQALSRQLQALGPGEQLERAKQQLKNANQRLNVGLGHQLNTAKKQIAALSRMLQSVSPLPTISRGFAVVRNSQGDVLTGVGDIKKDDTTTTHFSDGIIISKVLKARPGVTLSDPVEQ